MTSSPSYSLTADAVRRLRVGLPVFTTCFVDTETKDRDAAGVDTADIDDTTARSLIDDRTEDVASQLIGYISS
ncbi:hypothetical protein JCM30237_24020 [Halolamina litorea]